MFHERPFRSWTLRLFISIHTLPPRYCTPFFSSSSFILEGNMWTRCFIHIRSNDRWNFFFFGQSKNSFASQRSHSSLDGRSWSVFAWRKSDVSKQAKALVLDCKRIAHLRVRRRQKASQFTRNSSAFKEKKRRWELRESETRESSREEYVVAFVEWLCMYRPVHYQRILTFFSSNNSLVLKFEEFRRIFFFLFLFFELSF